MPNATFVDTQTAIECMALLFILYTVDDHSMIINPIDKTFLDI